MSAFVFFFFVWLAAMAMWWLLSKWYRSSDADRIKTRVAGTPAKKPKAAAKVALFEKDQTNGNQLIARALLKYSLAEKCRALIDQAGLKWQPVTLIQSSLGLLIGGYFLASSLLPDRFRIYAIAVGLVLGLVPFGYVRRLRRTRLEAFEAIFPDSLEFISRSMRAGHAFSVSLEMIHREFAEPLSGEFRRTFEEHNLGLPLDVALQGLANRVPLMDVGFFVSAVLLQKRTGGNLAEILDKLAYVIRERFKLRGRIRAVSAHGRMTGMALTCIPIGVALIMFFVNPEYVQFFFNDDLGNIMLGIGVALQVAGYLVIQKIVTIEI